MQASLKIQPSTFQLKLDLCRGPAPVDPGNSKQGWRWQGKNLLFIYKYKIRLGRNSVVGKLSGERRLNNLVYMGSQ